MIMGKCISESAKIKMMQLLYIEYLQSLQEALSTVQWLIETYYRYTQSLIHHGQH